MLQRKVRLNIIITDITNIHVIIANTKAEHPIIRVELKLVVGIYAKALALKQKRVQHKIIIIMYISVGAEAVVIGHNCIIVIVIAVFDGSFLDMGVAFVEE
jgi:hypothetical protein